MSKRLDDYWVFNTEKFIKDYPKNLQFLSDKQDELAEITEIRTPNFDAPPGTAKRGDCVAAAAERIERLTDELSQAQQIVSVYDNAYNQLTDSEKMIIRYFFHEPGLKSSNIRYLMNELNYSEREIYRQRANTIEKFKKFLGV